MKITGIIAEYNPFHNGHLYQIEQVKKNGADYVVIVMSGNFLQRGTPAILDKWSRTQMALSCGADLIIELPAVLATASAQYFARGGVSILDKLGCIDTISFGCESDDISMIQTLSSYLSDEPDNYKEKLQHYLRDGNSFPKARALALSDCLSAKTVAFASSPNNILALEYCIALLERNSSMNILPIKREGSGYHDTFLSKDTFASATAIREILEKATPNENTCNNSVLSTELIDYLPEAVYSILAKKENEAAGSAVYKVAGPFTPAILAEGLKLLVAREVPIGTILINEQDWMSLLQLQQGQAGSAVMEDIIHNGYSYTKLFGYNFVRTIKNDIVKPGHIYLFSTPEFLGVFDVLEDVKAFMETRGNKFSFYLWETIGIAIGNDNGLAKIELVAKAPAGSGTGDTDAGIVEG